MASSQKQEFVMNLVVGLPIIALGTASLGGLGFFIEQTKSEIDEGRYNYNGFTSSKICKIASLALMCVSAAFASLATLSLGITCATLASGLSLGTMLTTAAAQAVWPLTASALLPFPACFVFAMGN